MACQFWDTAKGTTQSKYQGVAAGDDTKTREDKVCSLVLSSAFIPSLVIKSSLIENALKVQAGSLQLRLSRYPRAAAGHLAAFLGARVVLRPSATAYRSVANGALSLSWQIFIRSTDCDRTLMSAEANLAGLYPPEGQQMFNPNISWQPIPVHTVPESEERLLKFPLTPCPRYEQLQNETRHSAEYINKTKENWQFLQMVANKTGIRDVSLDSVWSVYDTLFCEQAHKMDLPVWVTPDVMARLKQLKDFGFEFLFGIHKRVEKARLQGGVLLDDIRKNLTRAANVSAHLNLKVLAYSAHDTTLVALQMALDVYNKIQAPYASCHLFELYQEDDGNFSVEMFFRNESGKEPFPLTIPGCQHKCPLQRFLELTDPIVPQDWKQECQVASTIHDTELFVGLAVCGSILLLLIILLLTVLFRIQSQPPGYRHVSNEGEEQA
ncbi:lysosomal acid phosphatase [Athene cunicularia]|uniref:lysosomal acid phosphatase n=1 Tax=Athene cunicularia TaxID=194338 RepID=UPI000EF6ABFD|nr:lysosomal acid phosphatase [Athene cunicularia]